MKIHYTKTVLYNGVTIPNIGYGTYKTPCNEEGLHAIQNAINAGYRHLDTAQGYKNETLIAQAIQSSHLERKDFFITSKLWNDNQGYEKTIRSFFKTLNDLQTDYLDLFLIHWPIPIGAEKHWQDLNISTWKAFEDLYSAGRIRSIGVSNFLEHHLKNILNHCRIKPMVNQLEFHPKYQQRDIVSFCQKHDILVESWGPLMRGKAFENPILKSLSEKSGHTIAQILLRYCIQKNILPIQKSMKLDRMISNADIFNFCLSKEEMDILDSMDTANCYTFHPDRNFEWFK